MFDQSTPALNAGDLVAEATLKVHPEGPSSLAGDDHGDIKDTPLYAATATGTSYPLRLLRNVNPSFLAHHEDRSEERGCGRPN